MIKSPDQLGNVGILSTSDHKGIRYENMEFKNLRFDSTIVQQYYQFLAKQDIDEHKKEYGIDLKIPVHLSF